MESIEERLARTMFELHQARYELSKAHEGKEPGDIDEAYVRQYTHARQAYYEAVREACK